MATPKRVRLVVVLLAILFVATAHEVVRAYTGDSSCGEKLEHDRQVLELRYAICWYKSAAEGNPIKGAVMVRNCEFVHNSDVVQAVVDYGWCMGVGGLVGWFKS